MSRWMPGVPYPDRPRVVAGPKYPVPPEPVAPTSVQLEGDELKAAPSGG